MDKNIYKDLNILRYKSCIPRVGLTSTIGPFQAGTGVGFFLHADGANIDYLSDSCRGKTTLQGCLIQKGGRDYSCYDENSCSIDASKDPVKPRFTT